jgi:hypothetical protein
MKFGVPCMVAALVGCCVGVEVRPSAPEAWGRSVEAPSLQCGTDEPFAVEIPAQSVGCFHMWGLEMRLERFAGDVALVTSRGTRLLPERAADAVLATVETILAEPERSGAWGTTQTDVTVAVSCGGQVEAADLTTYAVDGEDLVALPMMSIETDDELGRSLRAAFSRARALTRLVETLNDPSWTP